MLDLHLQVSTTGGSCTLLPPLGPNADTPASVSRMASPYRKAGYSAFSFGASSAGTQVIEKSHGHIVNEVIEARSNRGDLVLDPICGVGTSLVEAARLGRRAIGVEQDARAVIIARANLNRVLSQNRENRAVVLRGDGAKLPHVLTGRAARQVMNSPSSAQDTDVEPLAYGRIDLIVISPPRHESYRLESVCRACATVLKPGGYLVFVTESRASLWDSASVTHHVRAVRKPP